MSLSKFQFPFVLPTPTKVHTEEILFHVIKIIQCNTNLTFNYLLSKIPYTTINHLANNSSPLILEMQLPQSRQYLRMNDP